MARRALLCGINAYVGQPLNGCVNDALHLQSLFRDHFGFPSEQIQLLLDQDCIRSNLLEGWRQLTEGAVAGDVLVFHFSGHGTYIPDQQGEEADLRDEITCLQDFDFSDSNSYLTDDEWFELTQSVPEDVHLLILKDTCHSGGSSRFIGVRQSNGMEKIILANTGELKAFGAADLIPEASVSNARFIVPPQLPAEAWQHSGTSRKVGRGSAVVHTNLMACSESQTAADDCIDGVYQGAFTHHLCAALRQGAVGDSNQLLSTVAAMLSRRRYTQIPQHEGRAFDLSLLFGSGGTRPASTLVRQDSAPVQPIGIPPFPFPPSTPQQMVYEAHMRFLETMRALHGRDPGGAA